MPGSTVGHTPQRVNGRCDPIVCVAQDPPMIFNRAHSRHIQVLPWSAGIPIPAVVRDIDKNLCSIHGKLTHFVGKDRFIADKDSKLMPIGTEDPAISAPVKVSNLLRKVLCKEKDLAVRDKLAKRHQMDLVIASDDVAIGGRKNRRVVLARLVFSNGPCNYRTAVCRSNFSHQSNKAWIIAAKG